MKKLTYDYIGEDEKKNKEKDYHKEFNRNFDLEINLKPEKNEEKPYKEDFFSNFETYHVCDDYADDIINYLKERDVKLSKKSH